MKVVKDSVRRTLRIVMDSEDDSSLTVLQTRIVRIRASHLNEQAFTAVKTVRLKGDCKKLRYRDLDEALEALHRIENYRSYIEESGVSSTQRREKRAYKCQVCLGAHLTSKSLLSELVTHVA